MSDEAGRGPFNDERDAGWRVTLGMAGGKLGKERAL